jgi:hypothetical protein
MLKLDPKKELNLEELQHFFSETAEFVVVQTKPHTFSISFDGNMGLHKTTDNLCRFFNGIKLYVSFSFACEGFKI